MPFAFCLGACRCSNRSEADEHPRRAAWMRLPTDSGSHAAPQDAVDRFALVGDSDGLYDIHDSNALTAEPSAPRKPLSGFQENGPGTMRNTKIKERGTGRGRAMGTQKDTWPQAEQWTEPQPWRITPSISRGTKDGFPAHIKKAPKPFDLGAFAISRWIKSLLLRCGLYASSSFSTVASFTQQTNTFRALSSSLSGGSVGAMRMLESCGSFL